MSDRDTIERAIRHIDSCLDVDPWARDIAIDAMKAQLSEEGTTKGTTSDCIRRQDAIDALENCEPGEELFMIKSLPSVQPERKTGHWEFQGDQMFACTCCSYLASQEQLESWRVKKTDSVFPLFCPQCGADMRGETDE